MAGALFRAGLRFCMKQAPKATKAVVRTAKPVVSKGKSILSKVDDIGEFTLNGQHAFTNGFKRQSGSFVQKAQAGMRSVQAQKTAAKVGSTNIVSRVVNSNFVTRNAWAATKNVGKVGKDLLKGQGKQAWKDLNGNLLLQTGFLYGIGVPATMKAYDQEGFWGAAREAGKQFLSLAGGTMGMTLGGFIPKVGFITGFLGWGAGEKIVGKSASLIIGQSLSDKELELIQEYGIDQETIDEYEKQGMKVEQIKERCEENRAYVTRILTGNITAAELTDLKNKGYTDEEISELLKYRLTEEDIEKSDCRPEELYEILVGCDISPEDIQAAKAQGKTIKDLIDERSDKLANELKDKYGLVEDDYKGKMWMRCVMNGVKVLSYLNLDFDKYKDTTETSTLLALKAQLEDYGITKTYIAQCREKGLELQDIIAKADEDYRKHIAELCGSEISDEDINKACEEYELTVPQLYRYLATGSVEQNTAVAQADVSTAADQQATASASAPATPSAGSADQTNTNELLAQAEEAEQNEFHAPSFNDIMEGSAGSDSGSSTGTASGTHAQVEFHAPRFSDFIGGGYGSYSTYSAPMFQAPSFSQFTGGMGQFSYNNPFSTGYYPMYSTMGNPFMMDYQNQFGYMA